MPAAAEARRARRRASVPPITYPPQLPVSERKDEIAAAIRDHQVVIVAGETGSGKTTQLPKICLELGRGIAGTIAHTQPRRLAARTVAERIAQELGVTLGEAVGYAVRFSDRSRADTLIRLMTDGLLLAQIRQDRLLRRYDTVIVDEAHERSLNIDFLLGYLARILPRRPDLKLIITSATIDPQRFAAHFGDAPVVEVSGRTYPVALRYRPVGDGDQTDAIGDAVEELLREPPGDVLVFLSGEREIRDTAEALQGRLRPDVEILPLYARLSTREQHRVFQPSGARRIVLATNVAETSLTVPGIRYVVDPGTARISRYSARLKVQRLPIEPVSQASADQRKGRCGRVADGICIRLYDEQDFEERPRFTDPEILRTNLASVLLQMAAAKLGDIADFPFLDPPDRRQVRDGIRLLQELAALDEREELTPLGRRLAQLPVDPRLGRMILEADRLGCAEEVIVITAALSIQDPRERPAEKREQADQLHARFADEHSDFLAFLNLWRYLREQQRALSGNQFRRRCHAEFLHHLRVREWQDLVAQLRQAAKQVDVTLNRAEAEPETIHAALLAGLLSQLGLKDPARREFQGARGARFALWPGSALAKRPPTWVMVAELVETSRLWGRVAARIDPRAVEPLAQHLVSRTYDEPRWNRKRASVVATERVTLYGLPIVAGRTVAYGGIDPELSRSLFIRSALVEGDWEARHRFLAANRELLERVDELEARARRRDIRVTDQAPVRLLRRADPGRRRLRRALRPLVARRAPRRPRPADVPRGRRGRRGGRRARPPRGPGGLAPGRPDAAAELRVRPGRGARRGDRPRPAHRAPAAQAARLRLARPRPARGARHRADPVAAEGAPALARPGARGRRGRARARDAALRAAARRARARAGGAPRRPDPALRVGSRPAPAAPAHDLPRRGRPRRARRRGQRPRRAARAGPPAPARAAERRGVTARAPRDDPLGGRRAAEGGRAAGDRRVGPRLPRARRRGRDGRRPRARDPRRPARGDARRHAQAARARHAVPDPPPPGAPERGGRARAGARAGRQPARRARGRDGRRARVADGGGGRTGLGRRRLRAAARARRRRAGGADGDDRRGRSCGSSTRARDVERRLEPLARAPALAEARDDVARQLERLVHPGFVAETGAARLDDVERYLRAAARRLERLPDAPGPDRDKLHGVQELEREYAARVDSWPDGRPLPPALRDIPWQLEELRVAHFAQGLGVRGQVSAKRIRRAIREAVPA